MQNSPLYYKPLMLSNSIKTNSLVWHEAIDLFKNKEYQDSFYKFLDYLDPDIRNNKKSKDFAVPHGSSVIHIQLTDKGIDIKTYVSKITSDTLTIPLMRALCEINFNKLSLARATLVDNKILFHYFADYELFSSWKLYDVISDICRYADMYRAEFSKKFNAHPAEDSIVENYSEKLKDQVFSDMQKVLDSSISQFDGYIKDRKERLSFTALGVAITQLEFYLQPQGYLKTLFDRNIWNYYDTDIDFYARINQAKEFLVELQAMSKQEIVDYLYKTKEFSPIRSSISIDKIKKRWNTSFGYIKTAMADGNYEYATMDILNEIYMLFSYFSLPDEISNPLYNSLELASGKSWEQSANILYDVFCFVMMDDYVLKNKVKVGFIDRVFKSKK